MTILFTDVEGSTELRNRFGDRVADEVLRIHERIVRGQISAHGGQEVVFLGDGFMAAFPDPGAALDAAIAIQRALDEHNQAHADRQVRVRIGIHHGEVTERDGTLYGQAVHAAARVASQAAGRQVFASSEVRDLLSGRTDARFVDRGLFWLKGFPDLWRLHQVEWDGAPAPVAPAHRTPFVEREEERADLRRAVDQALGGHGRFVLIGGEAGVGKTRLTQEVDAEAEARGMRILVGHCVDMAGGPPYLPFVEILEQALVDQRSTEVMREALGDAAGEVARIVPTLRRVFPDLPAPLDLPPEQARRYLWVSVTEFIERAARTRPILFVLEDLHWADESTLALLDFLAPHLATMPVLMVGTYRDVEVGISHPLARMTNQLGRRRLVDRISLRRLSRDGVEAILRGMSGQEPPAALVQAIHKESEGNPFFVEEIYLHLADSGRLLDEGGRFKPNLRIDELDVPESVRLVIEERLVRLSDATREALVAAAVSGRVFDVDVVARVAELSPEQLMDAFDEAERARLVAPATAGGARMAFAHELIRQTLLADTSTVRRQRLHAKTADAMEGVYAEDVETHAEDMAYHLLQGADHRRLVRYLRVAGDRAMEASAFEDAVAHFDRAASLVPPTDRDGRAELLERLAMADRSVGRWDDALRAMDQALALYEELGRTDDLGRLASTMVYQLGWAARLPEAVGVAQRGLAALGDLPNPDRARLLASLGWIMSLAGDYASATGMFDQARTLAEQLGDDRALADILHMETIHHMGFAEFPQGIESGLRAAKVLEADGALWDLSSVLAFTLFQAGTIGRQRQTEELAERAWPLAERLGHLGAAFMILTDRARRDGIMAGGLRALKAIAAEQLEVCERGGLPWIYVGHMYLGLAAHWMGDRETAERELRLAVEMEPPAAFAGQSASLLAMHLAYRGRSDEVQALYDGWKENLPVAGQVNSLGVWNTMLGFVEALAVAGRTEEAAALLPLVEDALSIGLDWITFDCRMIRTRAGIAAAAAGRFDEAETHFEEALLMARGVPNRLEEADVLRLHAEALLARGAWGDRVVAAEKLREAAGAYERMAMPDLLARTHELLERVEEPSP